MKHGSLVGAVGEQLRQEREESEQGRQQCDAAVAILDAGRRHERLQQQTPRIDENVTLFSLYQFACVEARRVDAGPPFSALLTLWLSTMQAVGLASRPILSRHLT